VQNSYTTHGAAGAVICTVIGLACWSIPAYLSAVVPFVILSRIAGVRIYPLEKDANSLKESR
jgi:hypothetical protein